MPYLIVLGVALLSIITGADSLKGVGFIGACVVVAVIIGAIKK